MAKTIAAKSATGKKQSIAPAEEALADVFISYSRKDEAMAKKVRQLLISEGFEVWFDENIYGGSDWETILMQYLTTAKAIVVLWTKNSVKSKWVVKEAGFAMRTRRLIPVVLDECKIETAFQTIQHVMLKGWNGADAHPKLSQLLTGIAQLAPPSRIDNVRPGFDTTFLGTETELPSVAGVAEEFRYLHFSVIMNPARRLPWYVAYNLAPRNKEVERSDKWMPDPQLPQSFQPADEHYKGTGYNRGHLVSPSSVSWGDLREAQLANRQAFFWTNTAPQHPHLNQGNWWQIEKWEKQLAADYKKITGFAGPVLTSEDPVWQNTENMVGRLRLRQNFRLPNRFWKVVLIKKGKQLMSAAFMVKQGEGRLEKIENFQCSIADIEEATGLQFSEAIRKARAIQMADL